MSRFAPACIPDDDRVLHEQFFFESHCHHQLQTYYPEESLLDASRDDLVSCWSDPPLLLKKLQEALPFGRITAPWDFKTFCDQVLEQISSYSLEQFLYWHLAQSTTVNNHPAETVLLWVKDDYLWFIHIPPCCQEYIQHILAGEHLRFIEQFHLNYDQIQINFQELHLVTGEEDSYDLVIPNGVKYTYKWDTEVWETTLQNCDSFIDPEVFHCPPETPEDQELLEFAEAIELRNQDTCAVTAAQIPNPWNENLPPSSPPSPSTSEVSGWNNSNNQWPVYHCCWCTKEVCDCGFCPDTPPTPPSVVLWSPGNNYLPFRE